MITLTFIIVYSIGLLFTYFIQKAFLYSEARKSGIYPNMDNGTHAIVVWVIWLFSPILMIVAVFRLTKLMFRNNNPKIKR